jgi:hypothetical protein
MQGNPGECLEIVDDTSRLWSAIRKNRVHHPEQGKREK